MPDTATRTEWAPAARDAKLYTSRDMARYLHAPASPYWVVYSETEARLWATLHILGKRPEYERRGTWPDAWNVIRDEICESYLGELFAYGRDRVKAKKSAPASDESIAS